jgi:hypothetical protein
MHYLGVVVASLVTLHGGYNGAISIRRCTIASCPPMVLDLASNEARCITGSLRLQGWALFTELPRRGLLGFSDVHKIGMRVGVYE